MYQLICCSVTQLVSCSIGQLNSFGIIITYSVIQSFCWSVILEVKGSASQSVYQPISLLSYQLLTYQFVKFINSCCSSFTVHQSVTSPDCQSISQSFSQSVRYLDSGSVCRGIILPFGISFCSLLDNWSAQVRQCNQQNSVDSISQSASV